MNSQPSTPGQSRLLELLEQWGLPKDAISGLVGRHTLVRYPKRSPLFLQGSPADVVFVVFNGLVKVYCPGPDGNRILVHLAGPGDLIGYADFVDAHRQRSQMFEAHALTSCSVALFTRQHVLKTMRGLDQAALASFLESLNGFWSSVVHRYAVYLSMSLRERLQMVLAELGARFGVQDARGVLLTPELSQEELAEMIGSSRPMVSKLLSEMAERAMLACQGRRYILLRGSGLEVAPRWLNPGFARTMAANSADTGLRGALPAAIAERNSGQLPGGLSARADRAA
jgi:CRP/FNR family cyclic AMP-dependent transcriptional regulator